MHLVIVISEVKSEKANYKIGYVGVIDILGFGSFSEDHDNFQRIRYMMDLICYQKRNFERNFDVKYSILSDTVVIMVELTDLKKFDYVFLESVVFEIGYLRSYILKSTGLYSRAAITFGEYYYDEKRNLIFGPAVTKAAKLAEKSGDYISTQDDKRFSERPAAIIIDEVFTKKTSNPFYSYFFDGCVGDCLSNFRFRKIGNTNYYLYNPYYECFDDYRYNSVDEEDRNFESLFESFSRIEKDRLNVRIENASDENKKKYDVEKDLLEEFIANPPNQG